MITTDCAEGDELTGYGVAVDIFEYDSRDTTFMVEQHDIQYFTQCQ